MESDSATTVRQATDELASTLKRTEVQRGLSSIPGREIVQVLTLIPVGVESGWHTHPGEEVGYILAGTVTMARAASMLRPPANLSRTPAPTGSIPVKICPVEMCGASSCAITSVSVAEPPAST